MKVIPVIDVLNGVAVHGKRGERNQYKPLKSCLLKSTNPLTIASFFEAVGFTKLYLADLDAILGKPMNLNLIKQIAQTTNLDFMVDSGASELKRVQEVLDAKVSKVIIGSETLQSLDFVKQSIERFGENNVTISIDQKNGKLLTKSSLLSSLDVFSFVKKLEGLGVTEIILLDLSRVGTEFGVDLQFIKHLVEKTKVDVIVGGGIRSFTELDELNKIGVTGALVATTLHDRTLSFDDLKSANFF
ncbi:MAG: HisA/HisF-related TIM barrel protein [Candidatus Bathyarchaeota archaeon]|nr:HisA/HisF-related TIM barrel protein [Candidatus Bathyarchaeum sp.]